MSLVDLSRMLEEVRMLLRPPEARGVAFSVSGDQPARFAADPEQLRQVFLNLGINAIQPWPEGRAELSFRLQNVWLRRAPAFRNRNWETALIGPECCGASRYGAGSSLKC